jgi:hypothetical protein
MATLSVLASRLAYVASVAGDDGGFMDRLMDTPFTVDTYASWPLLTQRREPARRADPVSTLTVDEPGD